MDEQQIKTLAKKMLIISFEGRVEDCAVSDSDCGDAGRALLELNRRLEKAETTLRHAGFTDAGGELWKPPLGLSATDTYWQNSVSQLQAKADALAETIRAIAGLCTYQHESKGDFIGRVRAALGDDPDLRVSSVRAQRDKLLEELIGMCGAMRKALPYLPADHEAFYCGEWLDSAKEVVAGIQGPWCCEKGQTQGKQVCDECAEISAGYQSCMELSPEERAKREGGAA